MSLKTMQKLNNFLEKTLVISLIVGVLLHFSGAIDSVLQAKATIQPGYTLEIAKVDSAGTRISDYGKTISLGEGERARLRMQVNNPNPQNFIDNLWFKAYFNDNPNPTTFNAHIKTDDLEIQNDAVSVSVPESFYLEYVPETTRYIAGTGPETLVPDVNESSQLAFWPGFALTNISGGPEIWIWMYFDVKASESEPEIIKPNVQLEKYVANLSLGQSLDEKRTEATLSPGEKAKVRLIVKNSIDQSVAHNVKVSDQKPEGKDTLQVKTATVESAQLDPVSKAVTFNLTGDQPISFVGGTLTLRDINGSLISTLGAEDENSFFGEGYSLGDLWGTWEYSRMIEYEVTIPMGLLPEIVLRVDKKVGFVKGEYHEEIPKEGPHLAHIFMMDEKVYYKVEYKNTGNADGENVKIEDKLPEYIDWVGGQGSWDPNARTVNFEVGTLGAGEEGSFEYEAKVKEDFLGGPWKQENTAEIKREGKREDYDTAFVWVKGGEILAEKVEEVPEELPVAGAEAGGALMIVSWGMAILGWGLRQASFSFLPLRISGTFLVKGKRGEFYISPSLSS